MCADKLTPFQKFQVQLGKTKGIPCAADYGD